MDKWIGQVALVTGASSGIGAAIADKLVEHGLKVVGVARRLDRLEVLAKNCSNKKGKFYPQQGDVSKEEDILKAFKWTKENVGPVSILINNAGFARLGSLGEITTQDLKDVLDVNVYGVCVATREAIKQMKDNNIDGHVININSTAGHKVGIFLQSGVYPASKHALTALTETLRLELAAENSKIRVTSISPGGVYTEGFDDLMKKLNVPGEHVEAKKSQKAILDAVDVAEATLYALGAPKHVNISELTLQAVGENA